MPVLGTRSTGRTLVNSEDAAAALRDMRDPAVSQAGALEASAIVRATDMGDWGCQRRTPI